MRRMLRLADFLPNKIIDAPRCSKKFLEKQKVIEQPFFQGTARFGYYLKSTVTNPHMK
jgi:hypothetical protein